MNKRKTMQPSFGWETAAVLALIVVATFAVLLLPIPEAVYGVSDDETLEVFGVSRSVEEIHVETIELDATYSAAVQDRLYAVEARPDGIIHQATLRWYVSGDVIEERGQLHSWRIFIRSDHNTQWRPIETVIREDIGALEATVDLSSNTLIGLGSADEESGS